MQYIDVTTIEDNERQVLVHGDDDFTPLFRGPISEARERFPDLFSDTGAATSPAAAQAPLASPPELTIPASSGFLP